MACVALTSLMATIELEFLQPISRVSLHDDVIVKSFFEKLSSLQAFLRKESSGASAAIKDLETKIRDFALKAEDDIEIQLSKFILPKYTECREKTSQELHQILREATENAAELLKIINSTINEADEAKETQPSIHWLKHASTHENVESDISSQPSPKIEDGMVGRCRDCRVIKDKLFHDGDYDRRVISIVGMAGIGKTTLARSVYGDPSVALKFQVRRWIAIPQEYNVSQMLCYLLRSITLTKPNEIKKGSTPDEVTAQVYKSLKGGRYLIVLDNLKNNLAWQFIKQFFPSDRNGSCILLTTRHFHSDCYNLPTEYTHTHYMTLLDPNESWDLFCNILSLKENMAPKFEKIRSHVVEICEGLPQSIVTVAERLSKCNNIQQDWKKIEKELESLGTLHRDALTLSYKQLPQYLKVCFLYFGVFPKRREIVVKMLIRLWIAEGFLKSLGHCELETQAYGYLQDLIDRSLVLINNQSFDGKIKTCSIHSALHSFCVGEAHKEGILCTVNTQQHPRYSLNTFANSCSWLSLYSHSFDYYVLFRTNNPRSIFFFRGNLETFVPLKLLRVLAFVPSLFLQKATMDYLGSLVFLRYLSVTQWFEGLDVIVSTNPNLQTLVVSGNESQLGAPTLHLPSRIWESPRLRHLELGNLYTVDPPSMVKEKLQTLSWVSPTHCIKEVYYRFPNIKKLKIFHKDDLEPSHTRGSCSNPIILDYLDYLVHLEVLTISASVGCAVILPKWPMFPLQLKKLRLSGIYLSERDLRVIGMLPQLEVLKLENAFHGKVWDVAKGEFCQLRFLLIDAKHLEQLMACKDSFPRLGRLVLRYCYCLEEVPRCLGDSCLLHLIELEQCGPTIVASAKRFREAQLEMGNDIEIKIQGPEYDESQHTHIEESVEDDLDGLTVK